MMPHAFTMRFLISRFALAKKKGSARGLLSLPLNGFASQRVEERKQLEFLFLGQSRVTPGYGTRLATMAQDGLVPRGGESIMHQTVAGAQAPERRGAQFVGRVR